MGVKISWYYPFNCRAHSILREIRDRILIRFKNQPGVHKTPFLLKSRLYIWWKHRVSPVTLGFRENAVLPRSPVRAPAQLTHNTPRGRECVCVCLGLEKNAGEVHHLTNHCLGISHSTGPTVNHRWMLLKHHSLISYDSTVQYPKNKNYFILYEIGVNLEQIQWKGEKMEMWN